MLQTPPLPENFHVAEPVWGPAQQSSLRPRYRPTHHDRKWPGSPDWPTCQVKVSRGGGGLTSVVGGGGEPAGPNEFVLFDNNYATAAPSQFGGSRMVVIQVDEVQWKARADCCSPPPNLDCFFFACLLFPAFFLFLLGKFWGFEIVLLVFF